MNKKCMFVIGIPVIPKNFEVCHINESIHRSIVVFLNESSRDSLCKIAKK